MAGKLTPAQVAEKHARRTKAAVTDLVAGVEAVTVAPGTQAAKKADKMLAKLTEAVQSGKWARGVASVSLEEWKDKMKTKGAQRVAAGVDASITKTTKFFGQLLPYQEGALTEIAKMPDMTLEDSINRQAAWTRKMAAFKFNKAANS